MLGLCLPSEVHFCRDLEKGNSRKQPSGLEAGSGLATGRAQVRRVEGEGDGKVLGLPGHTEGSVAHIKCHRKAMEI